MNLSSVGMMRTMPVSVTSTGTSNRSAFTTALASASAPNSDAASATVTISDQAKVANAKLVDTSAFNSKAFFDASASMTAEQRKAYYTSAADTVSASQGLPSGQYDFHNMTSGEADVVYGSLLLNGKGTVDSLAGFSDAIATTAHDSNGMVDYNSQKHDYTAMMEGQRAFEGSSGNTTAANMITASLEIISQYQGAVTHKHLDTNTQSIQDLLKLSV